MRRSEDRIAIIIAVLEFIGIIAAAIIGAKWGKSNVEVMVQIGEEEIVLNNEDVKKMAKENEKLKKEISNYQKEIEELAEKLGTVSGELNDIPEMEYRNYGLSIDGEEKAIEKDKSSVLINGRKYYSKDFVDNLLPSDKTAIEKDEMLYIGKVVREKSNLFDRQMINISDSMYIKIEGNVKDTYGNIRNKALIFGWGEGSATYNANREFSKLKFTLAVRDKKSGGGIIQIESEEGILYTSEEILSTTEPIEIDIPINHASSITIKQIKEGRDLCNMVADAVLYNEE